MNTIDILLADDDKDDFLFFKDALAELSFDTSLFTVSDGEQLMEHLRNVTTNLPHVLFLDLNMPRKNGFECLIEIKSHSLLKDFPVIIFSTSYDEEKANQLYQIGAHYFICKPPDFNELKKVIYNALLLLQENKLKPSKENFLITKLKTVF